MQITHKSGIHVNSDDPKIFIYFAHSKISLRFRPILIFLRSQKMRVPILLFDDPAAKKAISKRQFLDLFDCIGRPCPRRVKACLSVLLCLAFFIFALYLNIATVFFWEKHSPGPVLPQGQQNVKIVRNESAEMDQRRRQMRAELDASLRELLKGMPAKDEGWCERMANNEMDQMETMALAQWKFDPKKFQILPNFRMGVDPANMPEFGCLALNRLFPFKREPLSEEERQFPLAYGLVVHKSAIQVFALLSAIYQPQNAYCLAVDERADEQFRQEMNLLADCFPNIFVMGVGKVEWCQFGVVRGVFNCLRYLSQLNHQWKYFQYLSGVDLPLKTNLEMVRIFKHLNGTVNAELLPFETGRVQGVQVLMNSPLTLWKSSLSALLSRQAVDAIVGSETVRQFLRYLQYGYCTDEALWATICGNPKELFIPGGFDATQLYGRLFKETYLSEIRQKRLELEKRQQQAKMISQTTLPPSVNDNSSSNSKESVGNVTEPFQLATYYISRYQVWRTTNLLSGSKETKCNGTFVSNSCVFGIADLTNLMKRPEMVVHKMYLEFQPAAYFCLWKKIHERTLDWRNQRKFEGKVYLELPTVKMANGASEDELRFFFD